MGVPGSPFVWANLGSVRYDLPDPEPALSLVPGAPGSPFVWANLGSVRYDLPDPEPALSLPKG